MTAMPISRRTGLPPLRSVAVRNIPPQDFKTMSTKIQKTDAEWKALLAEKGAEPAAFERANYMKTLDSYRPAN